MPIFGGGGGPALPVSIANGGTGSTTAAAALAALGAAAQGSHQRKFGSAAGDYAITATSFTDIDSTNLKITQSVATGLLAVSIFQASVKQVSGATGEMGIAIDGTVSFAALLGGTLSNGQLLGTVVMDVLVGDGASHTFSPQARVTNAADAFTVTNQAVPLSCMHFLLLLPAT